MRMAILLFYLLKPRQQIRILYAALLQAHDFYDFFELIDLILSLEQSHPRHEIMENTPQSPHIHCFPVMLRPKQQFWRSVKQRPDHVGHLPSHEIQLLSHSVINDLDMIIVGIDVSWVRLRDEVTFLRYKHDVGRLQISMNNLIPMKFLDALQDLLKNLLNGELFLPHDHLIQVYSQPLHHHHWLIFTYKRVDHPHQVFPTQDLRDIPLADETNRQANLIQCLEFFDCHDFLRLDVAPLVDSTVGTLLNALEDRVLLLEGI